MKQPAIVLISHARRGIRDILVFYTELATVRTRRRIENLARVTVVSEVVSAQHRGVP